MIEFPNGARLVTRVEDLPEPPSEGVEDLFMDLETTSRDASKDSLNPWGTCWVAGIALTHDSRPGAWYVPVGHSGSRWNLPREVVAHWARRWVDASKRWVNHNVKYDVHALMNDLKVDGATRELVCTVVRSKLLDSDRVFKGGYGLDALSKAWLREDIGRFEDAMRPYLQKNKDYGRIPPDVMAPYACQDVLTNRRLHRYLLANMPEESRAVMETETRLTTVLVHMERRGILVKPLDLQIKKVQCMQRMMDIEHELFRIVGYPVNPRSNDDCYDLVCNRYGLPVIARTEDDEETGRAGGPSFDKAALRSYANRIDAPTDVIEMLLEYRDRASMNGFVDNFLENGRPLSGDHASYSVMHTSHNQCVRTGRMSTSEPNQMALSPEAKKLIYPGEGMAFLSSDASQIEFRAISHYCNDQMVIKAYNENPDVDFHQLVADMCGISRKAAKTTNFAIAFGQGRAATVAQLAVNKDVIASILPIIDDMVKHGEIPESAKDQVFRRLATERGEAVYDKYHETFPLIKHTARDCGDVCRARGYVRNIRGRRRHLPEAHSHKAFNTINQSSAADIIKERMVALSEMLRNTGIELVCQVHDELVMVGPAELIEDPRTTRDIVALLEDVHCLRVPLRFKYGTSRKDWYSACKGPEDGGEGDKSVDLMDVARAGRLEHLRQPEWYQ